MSHRNVKRVERYLVGGIALLIMTAGCSSHTTRTSSPTTTTSANSVTVATTTPRPATGLTAEQLSAHLGVGVPSGWAPVDEGNARVWVPKDWILEPKGACIGSPSAVGMISVGSLPNTSCDQPVQFPLPKQAVALVPSSQMPDGKPIVTVHGYRIYNGDPQHVGSWKVFVVPQLGVRIAMHGTLSSRILTTLAPSARSVALDPFYESVPNGWRTSTENGVSLSIPPSWGVAIPNSFCGLPVSDSTLLLINPDIEVAPCPPPLPTPAGALHDGVALYLPPHNRFAPTPTGPSITTLHHGTTTIVIYPEPSDPNALDVFVRKSGSNITHVLTVGLGRDGRVAEGVLASIRATM
jgi:hypothetical protein